MSFECVLLSTLDPSGRMFLSEDNTKVSIAIGFISFVVRHNIERTRQNQLNRYVWNG